MPVASGTFGSLLALPLLVWLGRAGLPPAAVVGLIALVGVAAMPVCHRAGRIFGQVDSSRIVLDEVAGMLIAGALLPATAGTLVCAFLAFRFFDIVKPFPAPPARTFTEGITLSLVSVRRNHPLALNPMIKSNNLLNNALAMQEAIKTGADEALMRNQAGEIVECSQSNFFVVRKGAVLTPPLGAGLLPGLLPLGRGCGGRLQAMRQT